MNLVDLPTRDEEGHLRGVVETPRGSLAKIKYDPKTGCFELSRPLVLGVTYPYDWGFFPSTLAPDEDPLDVMIIHSGNTYPGVVIPCRAIGIVRLSQKRKKKAGRERNDRVIAVPYSEARFSLESGLSKRTKNELEQFFLNAVEMEGKGARVEGWGGTDEAESAIRKAQEAYAER